MPYASTIATRARVRKRRLFSIVAICAHCWPCASGDGGPRLPYVESWAPRRGEGQPIPALFKLAKMKIGDARQGDCSIGDNFYGCHCWFPNEWRRKRW